MSADAFQQLTAFIAAGRKRVHGSEYLPNFPELYVGERASGYPEEWYRSVTVAFPNGFGMFLTHYYNKDWLTAVFYENKNNKEGHKMLAKPRFAGRGPDAVNVLQYIEKVAALPDSRYKDYVVMNPGDGRECGPFAEPPVDYQYTLAQFQEALLKLQAQSAD